MIRDCTPDDAEYLAVHRFTMRQRRRLLFARWAWLHGRLDDGQAPDMPGGHASSESTKKPRRVQLARIPEWDGHD